MFKDASEPPPLTVTAVPPLLEPQDGQDRFVPKVEGVATMGEEAVTFAPTNVPRSIAAGAIALPVGCQP